MPTSLSEWREHRERESTGSVFEDKGVPRAERVSRHGDEHDPTSAESACERGDNRVSAEVDGDWAVERDGLPARWSHVRVCEFAEENAPDRPTHEQQGGEGRRPECDGFSRALIQLACTDRAVAHEQSAKKVAA